MYFWLLVQVGCVTRLVPQKGVHLIRHAIYRTLERGGQFILLGSSPVSSIQVCHWMDFFICKWHQHWIFQGHDLSLCLYSSNEHSKNHQDRTSNTGSWRLCVRAWHRLYQVSATNFIVQKLQFCPFCCNLDDACLFVYCVCRDICILTLPNLHDRVSLRG